MKVILTSCGLGNGGIKKKFLSYLPKKPDMIKALFIPTAANSADAIDVLPKCMNDLLHSEIEKDHINVYDLHKPMSVKELMNYDVVYFCGGDPQYLLDRINEVQFGESLKEFIKSDKIVVGVSAGSMIFSNDMKDNLGLLRQELYVHCEENDCEPLGVVDLNRDNVFHLSNTQGMIFEAENQAYIID